MSAVASSNGYVTVNAQVPWMTEMPSHWELQRGKTLFKKMQRPVREEDGTITAFRDGEVTLRSNRRTVGFTEAIQEHGYQGIRKGDLVIHAMDGFAGAIGVSDSDGKASPVYQVCVPRRSDANPHYFALLLRLMSRAGYIVALAKGIRERSTDFRYSDFGSQIFPLPPREEQDAIVAFLDCKLEKIDRFIANKRRLIELLEEDKSRRVSEVITRGMNDDQKIVPVHLPWLARIPAHWTKTRLKYLAVVQTDVTLGKKYSSTELVSRPYLRVANVQDGHLVLDDIATIEVPLADAARSELQAGDVLMTEGGDIDKLGRGHIWQGELERCLHQNHVFAVRTDKKQLLPEFLAALTTSRHGRSYFMHTAKKTTNLASTNSTTLKAFPVFLPSIAEQREILSHIAELSRTNDDAIERAEREIDLMNGFRTSLIAEAVTGKIDVRSNS